MGELLEVVAIADALSTLITSRFLVPLLLNSLAPRRHNHAVLLTPVSSLFFFAQFLLVISHHDTIQTFLSAFLFEDASILASHWVRDNDTYSMQPTPRPPRTDTRVFFEALLCAFDSSKNDDYLSFYGLMLIYAMFQNKAMFVENCRVDQKSMKIERTGKEKRREKQKIRKMEGDRAAETVICAFECCS
ncbi:unnamed protein product [Nippostrongylus brasiliensis]|uniref:Transmembrane protein n=1 Tax=Nippostrongylus brasiliensis TaxID=27835 RepID=A0A0N4XJP5_NIPBR|nr:unnamed protein product [Nippostrongylus brasiliensis]